MYDSFYGVFLPQKEVWKDIEDWEGLYQVSSYGRVRSLDREKYQKSSCGGMCTKLYKGRVLKLKKDSDGYLEVVLQESGNKKYWRVHGLVAITFLSESVNKVVDHKDNIRDNNHVWNLQWLTLRDNTQKGVDVGNISGHTIKLEESEREYIKSLLREGKSVRQATLISGRSRRTVGRINQSMLEQEI